MKFEEMQTAWKEQYPAKAGALAASLDAKLLERIRRSQRGYVRTIVLLVFNQMIATGMTVAAIIFEAGVGPHMPRRVIYEYGIGLGAGLALVIGLGIVIGRRAPGMYSILADRSGLSTADRVHRDSRRYRFGQAFADGNQVLGGLLQMALVIVIASHFGLHGVLRWLALGLVAMPVLAVLVHRMSLRSLRPKPAQSLTEVLTLSIRLTRSRAQWARQIWWQTGLGFAGVFLSLEPIWVNHGRIAWVLLLIFVPIVILTRWGVKKRVRRLVGRRLGELEGLRDGLVEGRRDSQSS